MEKFTTADDRVPADVSPDGQNAADPWEGSRDGTGGAGVKLVRAEAQGRPIE